ncbi:hypothetical protein [Sulfurimonas sp.]|uniref:hypothetical protein n=1 Tax=Sulfurimonas sp. TaxID=2022749 RepID=UPI002630A571|nr:hypothetical protein [Sulfurimonas sp.]
MDILLLVKSIAGLSAILVVLLLFFIYTSKNKSKKQKKKKSYTSPTPPKPKYDWNTLIKSVRNKQATTQELQETLALILKYHGTIPNKLGIRVNPEFDKYSEVLLRLCRHPNTNKDLIIDFDKELEKKNPEYIKEINDALTKGLNSRGV